MIAGLKNGLGITIYRDMKKFSLLESFKFSNEELEDFFLEEIDEKRFKLQEGFIDKDNRFYTDVAQVRPKDKLAKKIIITIKDIATGIKSNEGYCLNDLDIITKCLAKVKMFFFRTSETPNFIINPVYDDLEIILFIVGGEIQQEHTDTKTEINQLLDELKEVLKNRGYKRINNKSNNWLEIRTPKYPKVSSLYDNDYLLYMVIRRAADNQLEVTPRNQPLINWAAKVSQANYQVKLSGGDNQVVVQLKKN